MKHLQAVLILSTCPQLEDAKKLAYLLVENQLAACVNIIPQLLSVYRWENKIEQSNEYLLLIKTHVDAYERIEEMIVKNHPYELPEILMVPIQDGLPQYLTWINQGVSHVDFKNS